MPSRPGSATLARRLGARIRALRVESGRTQEKLAWDCGLAKAYLSQVEAGKRVPSVPVLFTLARELGVSAADVVGFDVARPALLLLDAARRRDEADVSRALSQLGGGKSSTPKSPRRASPGRLANPISQVGDLRSVVGRNVASLRRSRGLTQSALAALLGVAVTYLQRIEAGRQNVTLATLGALAEALRVPAAALLDLPPVVGASRR